MQLPRACGADGCEIALPAGGGLLPLCANHLKAEAFLREGELSRFCTQCARAHSLDSFDGKRRTCRVRIERRQKRLTAPKTVGATASRRPSKQLPANKTTSSPHERSASQPTSPPVPSVRGTYDELKSWADGLEAGWRRDSASALQGMASARLRPSVTSDDDLWHPAPAAAPMDASLMSTAGWDRFPRATNITMKMFSITPANLDPALRQHMEFLMEAVPADVQGALRPGCVLLSVDLWFRNPQELEAAQQALLQNIQDGKAGELFGQTDMDLNTHSGGFKVRLGEVVERFANQDSSAIVSANPVVCNPGVAEWCAVVSRSSPDAKIRMVCRVKGRFFDVPILEEVELPDGRVQYALCPPMDDNALGLAWLEVIETLPDGGEAISQPHPMFLTTRSDMCAEMSSLFEHAGPAQRRDMAGVLKDLEELLHPDEDKAPLNPSQPAALALLCARHGFHETLQEVLDEVEYRGCEGALAMMAHQAKQMYSGGIPQCAHLSRSRETLDVVRYRLMEAVDSSDTSTAPPLHTAAPELVEPSSASLHQVPHGSQGPCDLWGSTAMRALEHPAAVAVTMLCGALLAGILPGSKRWKLAHALLLPMLINVLVPTLYRRVYVRGMRTVQALASERNVPLCAGSLCLGDARLRNRFDKFALDMLQIKGRPAMYLVWMAFGVGFLPLHRSMRTDTNDCTWAIVAAVGACCAALYALRVLAVKRQSVRWLYRLNACVALAPPAQWLCSGYSAWMSDAEVDAPLMLKGEKGSGSLCAVVAVVFLLFRVFQVATLTPPSGREMWLFEALRIAVDLLGTFFTLAALGSHDPAAGFSFLVTAALILVQASVIAIAARVSLELQLTTSFLSQQCADGGKYKYN
mmetsp:Transcript_43364/g.112343  ORF Transcript_43364/g.112343 Transcript_43364/m.112343 type:complete len:865 (-) Transcript_43364:303-2897(-)